MKEYESLNISQNAILLDASKPGKLKPRKEKKKKLNMIGFILNNLTFYIEKMKCLTNTS